MERIFAAINNDVIVNTFVGDENFVNLISSNYDDVIEITYLNPTPGVNWTIESDEYRPPKPYQSWIWNVSFWEPPLPQPETDGPWNWNEENLQWDQVVIPES